MFEALFISGTRIFDQYSKQRFLRMRFNPYLKSYQLMNIMYRKMVGLLDDVRMVINLLN